MDKAPSSGDEAVMDDLEFEDDLKDKNFDDKDQPCEVSEEEIDLPKKKKRVQKEQMRVAVSAYKKVVENVEEEEQQRECTLIQVHIASLRNGKVTSSRLYYNNLVYAHPQSHNPLIPQPQCYRQE